ncbi:MAG: GNAT family N-acetyltransferase [Ruminiclostridium sp.]|nr:GNAT family N-acetyltransferase [Ruminiclostridium sp.]
MSLSFDFHKKATCSAYLFRDDTDVKYSFDAFNDVVFRLAKKEDFNNISRMSGDFFYDLERSIWKEGVIVFYLNDELIGAGSCQRIRDNMNYYDIGMVVAEKYRNRGIGTFIIIKLKEYCYNNNRIPVCGCWYFNYASKKTLEKAGFITKHRIIRFDF